MENGVPSFPLFNLPDAPLKCVLQNLDSCHQIGFSILSKRSKALVKCLDLEARKISITINTLVSMTVWLQNDFEIDWVFCKEKLPQIRVAGKNKTPTKMYTPDYVRTYTRENGVLNTYKWRKRGFEIKDWMNHLLSMFNDPKINNLWLHNDGAQFDLDSLHETINDVNEIIISDSYPATYIQHIVQTCSSAKNLEMSFDEENNHEKLHSIFCRNFDVLTLNQYYRIEQSVKLNDLLVMNSRSIRVDYIKLSQKDVNKFLRHWMNGSNLRMEHMVIRFSENINLDMAVILNGLQYQNAPPNQERLFKRVTKNWDGSRTLIVRGGFDIQRKDGTTATIIAHGQHQQYEFYAFEVFVWH